MNMEIVRMDSVNIFAHTNTCIMFGMQTREYDAGMQRLMCVCWNEWWAIDRSKNMPIDGWFR